MLHSLYFPHVASAKRTDHQEYFLLHPKWALPRLRPTHYRTVADRFWFAPHRYRVKLPTQKEHSHYLAHLGRSILRHEMPHQKPEPWSDLSRQSLLPEHINWPQYQNYKSARAPGLGIDHTTKLLTAAPRYWVLPK